jgi:tetratricopeptide (TPR) repeat protein
MGSPDNIAYNAHLAGYIFGIVVPLLMLVFKILPHNPFDLWTVFNRWRRRQQFQFMVADGYDPFQGTKPGRKRIFSKTTSVNPNQEEIMALRAEVNAAMFANNLGLAGEKYLQVLSLDDKQVLPQQQQLDIANHLMQTAQHREAAVAYELFLSYYPTYPFTEQVQLMLGLLYSRYLSNTELARQNLKKALEKLHNTTQIQMARDELNRLD